MTVHIVMTEDGQILKVFNSRKMANKWVDFKTRNNRSLDGYLVVQEWPVSEI